MNAGGVSWEWMAEVPQRLFLRKGNGNKCQVRMSRINVEHHDTVRFDMAVK